MEDFPTCYAGIDAGASRTKAVVLDQDQQLRGSAVFKSGTDFTVSATRALEQALKIAQLTVTDIQCLVSTGYGRNNIASADATRTEISCHAQGCYLYFSQAQTIIDIGGQDNKIIKLDDQGRRLDFKMNRKCAAGTGAFLEEMALRLDVELGSLDALARQSRQAVRLGSFCTVFAGTEVLENIRQGRAVADIVKGLFISVITRVLEMDTLTDTVVLTGGVAAHNPYLAQLMGEMLERPVQMPPHPQLTGAIGAALYAMQL